jgi:hypothetical protein
VRCPKNIHDHQAKAVEGVGGAGITIDDDVGNRSLTVSPVKKGLAGEATEEDGPGDGADQPPRVPDGK